MRIFRITGLVAMAAALAASGSVTSAKTAYVPIQFRTTSGIRPYVPVRMGQESFLMMVHANAAFTMMTTHANARKAGVTDAVHQDNYGITAAGHVSGLGRERAVLPQLTVAGRHFANVPILVFEIPQDPPVDGMLGRDWLRSARVILDYDSGRLGIPETPADSEAEDQRLVADGYIAHKLKPNPDTGSYIIDGSIDGHKVAMELSTVAENNIDLLFAKDVGLPIGPVVSEFGGPKGSQGPIYLAKRMLDIVVDGQPVVQDRPKIFDTYAYDSEQRPATPDADHLVRLGADFLLANQAVIDFGTNTLFLRPRSLTQPSPAK